MKHKTLIILFFFFQSNFSQDNNNCDEKLLTKEFIIESHSFEKKLNEPINDFSYFINCGLDSIDIEMCSNKLFLVSIISKLGKKENITHKDILEKYLELKNTEDYKLTKETIQISKELEHKIAGLKNWTNDSIKLKKINTQQYKIVEIKKFLDSNNNKYTFKEIFSKLLENKKITEKDYYFNQKLLFKNSGNISYEKLLENAKNTNKNILIYFSGQNCINCRKMEEIVFSEFDIFELMEKHFNFSCLFVDDKKELTNSEYYHSKKSNELIKTVGQKNIDLQKEKFNSTIQPFFAIINSSKGNIISTHSFTTNSQDFLIFLKSGLKQ